MGDLERRAAYLVAARLDNRGETLLRDTHEGVRVRGITHRVDGDCHLEGEEECPLCVQVAMGRSALSQCQTRNAGTYTAICAVLESDGEGDAARKLTVQLRLGRAGADGAPGDEVGNELW